MLLMNNRKILLSTSQTGTQADYLFCKTEFQIKWKKKKKKRVKNKKTNKKHRHPSLICSSSHLFFPKSPWLR